MKLSALAELMCLMLFISSILSLPRRLAKTITKHVPKYTSIDLTYEILGRAAFVEDISVVIVSTVVTPSDTLAGVAFRFNQNETHDIMTISPDGM